MWKEQKKLESLKKTLNCDHAPGEHLIGSSFVRRKSSQIRKMLPKSLHMATGKEIDIDVGFWKSVVIHKTVGSREDYEWEDVRVIIDSCNTYSELQEYVKKIRSHSLTVILV